LQPSDWEDVQAIYLEGIASGNATFEASVPNWEKWDRSRLQFGRLVAREENLVIRWAALSPVSDRCCYAGVAEASVYIGSPYGVKAPAPLCFGRLLKSPRSTASGHFKPASSLKTLPVSSSSESAVSARLAEESGWASSVVFGAMSCFWNAAAGS
jgi:hypothetical protein